MDNIEKIMIGIETHVQLNTKTKLFCGCSLKSIGKARPNSRTCPTCLGLPGSKPVVNEKAIESAVKVALALGCKIPNSILFSRKTYFYPDMPKNYQITEYEFPFAAGGGLETLDKDGRKKMIRIGRINLEEDPGKLVHVGGNITTATHTLIDYNRAGIPLCEIVTEPDFSSPKEVRIFLQRLTGILQYLNVFNPEELSLKSDVNVSLNGGERIEIKNVTGFKEAEQALNFEIIRQNSLIRNGETIKQETRAWDAKAKVTRLLRVKETAEDYGYIADPDLAKIEISETEKKRIAKSLPELPHQKAERYQKEFEISKELASSISGDLELAKLYETLVKETDPRLAATWINILKKNLFYNDLLLYETKLTKKLLVKLINSVNREKITALGGEMILREIMLKPKIFAKALKKYSKVSVKEAEKIADKVISQEKSAVEAFLKGDEKVMEFLIGKVVEKSGKRIDAESARRILSRKIRLK